MNSKKGLGLSPSINNLITPCPSMIDSFFNLFLKYNKITTENKENKNPYIFRYIKTLNNPDNPVFADLALQVCTSNIIIDSYTGTIVDHYLKIKGGVIIKSYAQCREHNSKSLDWMLNWHVNLVHLTREYLKGGWMLRAKVKREIEYTKCRYTILNNNGFENLSEVAKPEPLNEDSLE